VLDLPLTLAFGRTPPAKQVRAGLYYSDLMMGKKCVLEYLWTVFNFSLVSISPTFYD